MNAVLQIQNYEFRIRRYEIYRNSKINQNSEFKVLEFVFGSVELFSLLQSKNTTEIFLAVILFGLES